MSSKKAEVKGMRVICQGSHLELQEMSWTTSSGLEHRWERAARRGGVGSVFMIARLAPSGRFILVRQFRPPIETEVLEFPAGLVGKDEDPADAAVRELAEETGYHGRVLSLMRRRVSSPGMSAERSTLAVMEVDEAAPENENPVQHLESSEELTVLLVSPAELARLVLDPGAGDPAVDSKLSVLALGMQWGEGRG